MVSSLKHSFISIHFIMSIAAKVAKGRLQKKTDYLMTLIKRVGGYLAEITTS